MILPRGDEYNIAVQNPRISFDDNELKMSSVETTPLGLPKPYSGGFTITYRLSSTNKSWAVRCFHRDIQDLQVRYQAIGNFFARNHSQYFVEAKYLQNGIKIRGQSYPIIKMQWLDGAPLNIYLSKVYLQKSKVENLLNSFVELTKELEKYGIAHGDLQHGNIIVKNEKLYLIDYDGMYFPELSTLKANEIGHPNYQHPKRTAAQYNKDIDRFASIVIYLGLKAISINPNLWTKYDNSENILFKSQDFANPQQSQLIKDLLVIPECKSLTERLIGCCNLEFDKIPTLQDFLTGNFTPSKVPIPVPTTTTYKPRSPYVVLDGSKSGSILEHFGEKVEVIGRISAIWQSSTRHGDPYVFLNFGVYPSQTFTLVIWKEGLENLRNRGISPNSFVGKYVSVIGVIGSYGGKPQTTIELATQIQVLSGQVEVNKILEYKPITISTPPPAPKPRVEDNGKRVFDDLYKNRPVSVSPKPNTIPSPIPKPVTTPSYKPPTYSSSNTNSYKPSSNPPKKDDGWGGCIVLIIFVVLGTIGLGAISNGKLWFVGAIIGGIVGGWILSLFKS
jgi:hypothetical protein